MTWHDDCLILAVFFGVLGATFLMAGYSSLNAVVGERSRKDGQTLMEKLHSESLQDYWEARWEMISLKPVVWAKQRFTRCLVYFGLAFFVLALILGEWATPLPFPHQPLGPPGNLPRQVTSNPR